MDYEETLLLLDGIVGSYAIVYPVEAGEGGSASEPQVFSGGGLWIAGLFKRDREGERIGAAARRGLMGETWYQELRPALDLGEGPLEGYERQAAHFTFEGMDDPHGSFAGFTLWRHEFIDSEWWDLPVRPEWLWIKTREVQLVVAAEFERTQQDT